PAQFAAEPGVARAATELAQGFQKTLPQRFAHHSLTTPIAFLVSAACLSGAAAIHPFRDTLGVRPQASGRYGKICAGLSGGRHRRAPRPVTTIDPARSGSHGPA